MHNNLLTHAIDREFPALATAVALLKATDQQFAKLLAQHDALDAQITKDEIGAAPIGDVLLEDLKKQRLHLKDELYRRASVSMRA
jgi:uncharacterized protein